MSFFISAESVENMPKAVHELTPWRSCRFDPACAECVNCFFSFEGEARALARTKRKPEY
jgi:hypothetical protein